MEQRGDANLLTTGTFMNFVKISFGFLAVALMADASARPDLNAFLNRKVTSVRELVEQVKSDPEVMDRFRRHYAMSSGEVITYLSTLQVGRTGKESIQSIYSVPPDGHIKLHYATVREGTPVFRDMAGNLVLILRCANPLDRGPKNPIAKNEEDEVIGATSGDFREVSPDVDLPASEEFLALVPPVPVVPEEMITFNQSPVTIIPAAFGFNPLWLALGLPLGFIGGGGNDDVPPVPEPLTFAVLGIGLIGLAARKRLR